MGRKQIAAFWAFLALLIGISYLEDSYAQFQQWTKPPITDLSSPGAIGGTTPAAGTFTTVNITTTTGILGPVSNTMFIASATGQDLRLNAGSTAGNIQLLSAGSSKWQMTGANGEFTPTVDIADNLGRPTLRVKDAYLSAIHNDGTGPANLPENVYRLTADFTTAANTSLQAITGLVITLPANTARNYTISCKLLYSQATAAVADQFGIQAATFSPTNIGASAKSYISASTLTVGTLVGLATTTATPVVTFTPSAITTVWAAELDALVENPSNASAQTLNIMAQTSAAADLLTVKRGSFCTVL